MWKFFGLGVVVSLLLQTAYGTAHLDPVNNNFTRIIGGESAKIENFPYIVSVHICTGSLVTSNCILTSAKCILDGSTLSIRAGSTKYGEGGVVGKVKNVMTHPGYNEQTSQNDIGVIILSKNLRLTQHIQTVRIATDGAQESYAGDRAIVTGWGQISESEHKFTPELHYSEVSIISDKECRKDYKDKRNIFDYQLCSIDPKGGKRVCAGDIGGPVVNFHGNIGVQIGIVGSTMGCTKKGNPNVYTEVSYFSRFVKDACSNLS